MEQFGSARELLDFAIKGEKEAQVFYLDLAKKMKSPAMKKVFEGFAAEEKAHQTHLECVVTEQCELLESINVQDLKIGDYLVDVEASPDMTYQDALILAMKKEKAAFKMYSDLAATCSGDKALCDMFQKFAQEEAKHKLRFEVEYDDNVLMEN